MVHFNIGKQDNSFMRSRSILAGPELEAAAFFFFLLPNTVLEDVPGDILRRAWENASLWILLLPLCMARSVDFICAGGCAKQGSRSHVCNCCLHSTKGGFSSGGRGVDGGG